MWLVLVIWTQGFKCIWCVQSNSYYPFFGGGVPVMLPQADLIFQGSSDLLLPWTHPVPVYLALNLFDAQNFDCLGPVEQVAFQVLLTCYLCSVLSSPSGRKLRRSRQFYISCTRSGILKDPWFFSGKWYWETTIWALGLCMVSRKWAISFKVKSWFHLGNCGSGVQGFYLPHWSYIVSPFSRAENSVCNTHLASYLP